MLRIRPSPPPHGRGLAVAAILFLSGCVSPHLVDARVSAADATAPVPAVRHIPVRTAEFGLTQPLNWPDRNQGVAPQSRVAP